MVCPHLKLKPRQSEITFTSHILDLLFSLPNFPSAFMSHPSLTLFVNFVSIGIMHLLQSKIVEWRLRYGLLWLRSLNPIRPWKMNQWRLETIRPTRSWVQILVWICWSGDLSFPPTPQLKSWSNSCVSPLSFDPIFKVNFTLFSVSFLGLYSWRWCLFFYLILNRTLIFNSVKY